MDRKVAYEFHEVHGELDYLQSQLSELRERVSKLEQLVLSQYNTIIGILQQIVKEGGSQP